MVRDGETEASEAQRVVILGGSGFIGRELSKSFAQSGHKVVAISRRPLLSNDKNVQPIEADFTDTAQIEALLQVDDVVIQLVNGINPSTGNAQLASDVEQEMLPQIRFLEASVRKGVKRVIFASSGGAIYGNAEQVPTSETFFSTPRNSYGLVKLAIEKYLELFHIEHGMDFVALRLANPYGPGQSFRRSQGFIVPSLLEKIGKGEELTIFGDGTDSRDYVYISDVIEAFHKSVRLNSPVAQTINVGGGAHYSVNELVEEIETALGRPVPRQHLDRRGSDIPRSFLDISKAKVALGWSPQVDLREGIKLVLKSEGIE